MLQAGVLSKNPSKYFSTVNHVAPAARTANFTPAGFIDRYSNGGYAALTLMLVPGAWTDGTHTFIIEESDTGNGTDQTTVNAADLLQASSFANISAASPPVQKVDYIGRLRYVRVRSTVTGATTGAVYGVLGLLFAPTVYPAAQP